MTMKTRENDGDVDAFVGSVENRTRREDLRTAIDLMQRVTGEEPRMWGDRIVGFGRYRYRRRDRSEHSWMLTGVAPGKSALTIYIMPGFSAYGDLLESLGPHRHSVSCLYISRLARVDLAVLEALVRRSVDDMRRIADAGSQ